MDRVGGNGMGSAPSPILVECPVCKQPNFIDAWARIDSVRNPEATEKLLKGKLFKHQCPVCGKKIATAYTCLYHDVEHRTLLLYSAESKALEQQHRSLLDAHAAQLERAAGLPEGSYQRRLVATTFELCEKARILAEGYDDRIIELMKVAIKRGMLEEGIIGPRDILIYERTLDDGSISYITLGEVDGDTVGVPGGYTYLQREWTEALNAIEGEYRYDAAWANAFLP